jgi:hypothetical protein
MSGLRHESRPEATWRELVGGETTEMAQPQTFPISEVQKLPYVRRMPDHGRVVPLRAYWHGEPGEWHTYFPVSKTELGRLAGGEPVIGSYLGAHPADAGSDREWPLGSFVIQHLSFPEVLPWLDRFEHRYYQLAVALDKYHLIAGTPSVRGRYMVLAELEYVLMLVRSLYDLLQRLIAALAATVRAPDNLSRRLISNLPDSFARVVLDGHDLRDAEGIAAKYSLPMPIAGFFQNEAVRFRVLRDIRDSIAHHGNSPGDIYATQSGFAVDVAQAPWKELEIWHQDQLRREHFGSLRLVFAAVTKAAFDATTRFGEAFSSCVAVPISIGEDLRLFLRHPSGEWLVRLDELIAQPWEGESTESVAQRADGAAGARGS